ncbi:hypothetical protein GGX14DRAFT_466417 [Mycena pura]|uniref:DUF6534 domain-containing protein n=1 Tax=Mycena pura TaxID=153505 RepID=A0AAD6V5M7_9AGAR|nr:hypothetical protein GGX14DRAFT_466417 [Mycena pura]
MADPGFQVQVEQLTIPIFIGTVINWGLLGVLAVQVYIYYVAFPDDLRVSKIVVPFVMIADVLQTLGNSRDAFRGFGSGWGDFNALDEVGWAWLSVPVLGSTVACAGQLFFAWRIKIIADSLYIPAVIALMTVFQFGAGIWTGVDIMRAKRFSLLHGLKPPQAWLAATAASDVVIVVAMVVYILKKRTQGFSASMEVSIKRIVKVTVETGFLCAVFALVTLYLFVAYDGNNYHLGTCIWLSKLYSNSILLILNSRARIERRTADSTASVSVDVVCHTNGNPSGISALQFAVSTRTSGTTGTMMQQSHAEKEIDSV